MTRPLDDFLSDYVYAQPRVLLAPGVFAPAGLAASAAVSRAGERVTFIGVVRRRGFE